MGVFGFAPDVPADLVRQPAHRARAIPRASRASSRPRSATSTTTATSTCSSGQPVNSVSARVQSIHYFKWGELRASSRSRTPLPSTPGVDAVAIADVDGDGCNDVVAAPAPTARG